MLLPWNWIPNSKSKNKSPSNALATLLHAAACLPQDGLALHPGHVLVNNLRTRLQADITRYTLAWFPGLHHCSVFDHLLYTKQRGKPWESSSCAVMWHNHRYMQAHRRWRTTKNLKADCRTRVFKAASLQLYAPDTQGRSTYSLWNITVRHSHAYPLSTWHHCTW